MSNSNWLDWAREIHSLTQAGLTYCKNEYDLDRYRRLQRISADIIASQSGLGLETVLGSFSMQAGYATPKVDVRAATLCAGKILLVQEAIDGRWSMPGGWADPGDSPAAMAVRETREESGYRVVVDKLIAVYDVNRIQPYEFYHAYKLVFLCNFVGGEPSGSMETLAVNFFDRNELPPLSEVRTNRRMLDEVFAHAADPLRPAYFE